MSGSNRFTFLLGGEVGHGVKRAGTVAAELFAESGRYAFEYDEFQSLTKGGHNFSVVTSSVQPVFSQYLHADSVVEFELVFDTDDAYDVALLSRVAMRIIWAYGPTDSEGVKYSIRGYRELVP